MVRIPTRLTLGKNYKIAISIVAPTVLRDIDEEDLIPDGLWISLLGRKSDSSFIGHILINNKLTKANQWATYWHELAHAVNDIMAWDRESGLRA